MGNTYYIGWDVGAWHCDKNPKSRDCLVVLKEGIKKPVREKRGNVRESINNGNGLVDFLNSYFNCCDFSVEDTYFFAIDAVFSWPQKIIGLLTTSMTEKYTIPKNAIGNELLYRYTERFVSKNHIPRSVVQDPIGSQSTKVMFFLSKYDFLSRGNGIWCSTKDECHATAIETYPALLINEHTDQDDAEACALLSQTFCKNRQKLYSPEDAINDLTDIQEQNMARKSIAQEGWIWFPKEKLQI